MSSSDPCKALLMQHFLKDLTKMLSGVAFHAADTHRATSEGVARKGRLKETCGLEQRTNFFFRLRNRQKLMRIRFGCGLDSRIYGIWCTEAEETVEHRAYDKSTCFSTKIRTDVEETIEFQAYNAT